MLKLPNTYTGRHPDLAPLIPALTWFYGTLAQGDEPMGRAANDNDEPYPLSVPDRDPKPDSAEKAIADYLAGGMRIATNTRAAVQIVKEINSEPELRGPFLVHAGSVTHIWGKRVTQDAAKAAPPSRSKAAKAARKADRERWSDYMGAQFSTPRKLLFKWRKKCPPIDWTQFKHVRGDVPFAEARAACGLAPSAQEPLGFPWKPHPSTLFRGIVTGRGGAPGYGQDGEPTEEQVRRAHDDDYAAAGFILDRIGLEQFGRAEPDHFETLLAAGTAGSMADLVASNDNGTGKRKFVRAAESLQRFLAA